MGDEARPPCVVFDREPAASPAACHSCGMSAAAVHAQRCAELAVGKEWEQMRSAELRLPPGAGMEAAHMLAWASPRPHRMQMWGEIYCFVQFQCRWLKTVNHM